MRTRHLFVSFLLALSLSACAGPSALRPAKRGDVAALKAALDQDLRAGRLTRSSVVDIAEALAAHELTVAKGKDAVQRLQQVRFCVRPLADSLYDRAKSNDPSAPEAAMMLLQDHVVDYDSWRSHLADADPGWRAVGVRTLNDTDTGKQRRAAFLDPDENVRLAAVRASEEAHDPADATPLLEVARLDPNPLVRVSAVRAVAQIPSPEVVLRLKDLWPQASDAIRQSIVAAYSWPGMLAAGGERELILIAESTGGDAATLAGGVLLRHTPQTRGIGLSTLIKQITGGTGRERALAITFAPLEDPTAKDAIKKASEDADPEVKLAALAKLAQAPAEKAKALEGIGSLAASSLPIAAKAKAALARLGDARVTALLLKDGESKNAQHRIEAAQGLLDLGDIARAAMFLADPEAGVRTRTACEILRASERW